MKVKLLRVGPIGTNCYILEDDQTNLAAVIDPGDEPELIDRLANRMDSFDYVCTFNGRTFDMPLLEARFTMTRMRHRWREMENLH